MIAGKGTYRIEKGRLLEFAGLDFFGLAGVGFLNRPVSIADPSPPPFCVRCFATRQETKATFDFGGGLELVPARIVAIRFDVTGTKFSF